MILYYVNKKTLLVEGIFDDSIYVAPLEKDQAVIQKEEFRSTHTGPVQRGGVWNGAKPWTLAYKVKKFFSSGKA
jgi:hypothetical protein